MLSPNKQTRNFFIPSKSGKTTYSEFQNSTTFIGRCLLFQIHQFILLLRLALKMKMSMGHFWKDIGKEKPDYPFKNLCPIGIPSITDSNELQRARTPAVAMSPGTYRLSHSTLFKTWSL